jgi:hypothetical protein
VPFFDIGTWPKVHLMHLGPNSVAVDTKFGILHPARDASHRSQYRLAVAAAAREGPLELMCRAREGADHPI